jgi:H+/Cl- antiporter ClcA
MGARNIVPLILLLVFVGILAAVGYVVYSIMQDVGKNTREKMERKNIAFTKDGMKVQVREIKDEAYKDQTQRCVCSVLFLLFIPCLFAANFLFLSVSWSTCGITLPSPLTRVGSGTCLVPLPRIRRTQLRSGSSMRCFDH